MKYTILLSLFFLTINSTFSQEIKVLSYNIRYDNQDDGLDSWTASKRNQKVASLLNELNADVIGIQEALHHQLTYLNNQLIQYKWIGVGRDDGKIEGEHAPIFYNHKKLKLKKWGYFWLSETPNKPSKGWDANCCNRIATWAIFKVKNLQFFFINTHFDHQGTRAQYESAQLILEKSQRFSKDLPIILTGDLNVSPSSSAIQTLKSKLKDSHSTALQLIGPNGTYNAFKHSMVPTDEKRIDYIFHSYSWKTIEFKTLDIKYQNRYPSDHFPILATLKLE